MQGLLVLLCSVLLVVHSAPSSCPCQFSQDAGEVVCDPHSQLSLPFSLPDCLAASVTDDMVSTFY